ncbi:MAG TPA: phage tail tube protein [Candidatus Brocadiia bacterium]|nr:phage tail tube protein [Candidatus Brocadiales bacterium]
MTQAKGCNVQLIFCEETTWGTTPASPICRVLPFTREGLATDVDTFSSARIKVDDRVVTDIKRGNKNIGGPVDFELDLSFHRLFKHVLGEASTTGSGPYTHVIKGGSALTAGLSIEKGFTDMAKYLVYRGMRVDTLSLKFSEDGYITGTFNFLGRYEGGGMGSGSGSGSSVSISTSPIDESKSPFTSYEAAVEEGGSTIGIVKEAKLEIRNNLQADGFVLGSGSRASAIEGLREVTGRLAILFEDLTYYNKFINGTESSLKFTMTRGSYFVEILIPRIVYAGASPIIVEGPGPLRVTLPFKAKKDIVEGTDIKVTFVNNIATV